MSIRLHFISSLQPLTDNQETVEVNGNTVGECLKDVVKRFPALRNKLFSRNGRLLRHIGIYIDGKNAFPDELARTTSDGDDVYILEIFTGG